MSENRLPDRRVIATIDPIDEGVFALGLDWHISACNRASKGIGVGTPQADGRKGRL